MKKEISIYDSELYNEIMRKISKETENISDEDDNYIFAAELELELDDLPFEPFSMFSKKKLEILAKNIKPYFEQLSEADKLIFISELAENETYKKFILKIEKENLLVER